MNEFIDHILGPLGALALSVAGNILLYRDNQALRKESRESLQFCHDESNKWRVVLDKIAEGYKAISEAIR